MQNFKWKWKNRIAVIVLAAICALGTASCAAPIDQIIGEFTEEVSGGTRKTEEENNSGITGGFTISEYTGEPYVRVNDNVPFLRKKKKPRTPLSLTASWTIWDGAAWHLPT